MAAINLQRKSIIFFVILMLLFGIGVTKSFGKVYMFIHAHPDDEIYFKSGWIYDRITSADTLIVVIATAGDANKWTYPAWEKSTDAKDFDGDGDIDMIDRGYDRMAFRSTPGLASLGLDTKKYLIFLGYPDGGIYDMWENKELQYLNPLTNSDTSPYVIDAPKYCYGLGYKKEVPYTYASLSEDIRRLYKTYKPDCVMVPDFLDTPSDHGALGRVATQALYDIRKEGGNDWVNRVEVIWSFPSHFVWSNPESWTGGKDFVPNSESPFLLEPFPQDIFPPQVRYQDQLGGLRKCKLWDYHPYEMPNPPCFRARKDDMFRGPFVLYDPTNPVFGSKVEAEKNKETQGYHVRIEVQDLEPGLHTSVAPQYLYSTDNGQSWMGQQGLKGYYRNKNNKSIYHTENFKNRPETENYSYWQGKVDLERVDLQIDFDDNFQTGETIQKNYWSAEWIGWVKTSDKSGMYHFYLDADDAGFLLVNNELIVWDLADHSMGEQRGVDIYLEKNRVYPIHLGFWNYTDSAGCKLLWKTPLLEQPEVIPASHLLCSDADVSGKDGTKAKHIVTIKTVPFIKNSNNNKIKFMVLDMAGNMGESLELTVNTNE